MPKNAISVRIDSTKIDELDQLAVINKRDRSFLINEAIDHYLEVNNWQIDRIKKSLKQAKSGKFVSKNKVNQALDKWRS